MFQAHVFRISARILIERDSSTVEISTLDLTSLEHPLGACKS